jgi:hypothetical protein
MDRATETPAWATGGCRTLTSLVQLAHRPRTRPAGSTTVTHHDFATTLHDGRSVIGRRRESHWQIHVYSPDRRLLGCGAAATRPDALASAGLSGEDAGEVLGRVGI